MAALFEGLKLFFETVLGLLPTLVSGVFNISNTIDSIKEGIIAAGLGVPVIVVSIFFAIVTITRVTFKIVDWLS